MDENKQIKQAQTKAEKLTMLVNKPVDNLLVLVLVINRDTGKIVDVVSKPSILNNEITTPVKNKPLATKELHKT